jgi:NADPH:quinone reductase-like Zn-dependent oxidoreductase
MARVVQFHRTGGPEVLQIDEVDGLASGELKPIVAKTFPFDKIVDAHRFMESNEQIGKIIVTVD